MRKDQKYYVYMLTNKTHSVLYTGMTNNIERRMIEHIEGRGSAFTKRYRVNKLVYMVEFSTAREAINAEKSLKAATRKRKNWLIYEVNPDWNDLYRG